MERKQLRFGDSALRFIHAGKATLTVVGAHSRFTYKIRAAKEGGVHFVSVLSGPDNYTNYQYIGFIKHGSLLAGKKGLPAAPSFKALNWTLAHLAKHPGQLEGPLEIWHEGKCGRCGRKLTVPESIDQGYGPECVKLMEKHQAGFKFA